MFLSVDHALFNVLIFANSYSDVMHGRLTVSSLFSYVAGDPHDHLPCFRSSGGLPIFTIKKVYSQGNGNSSGEQMFIALEKFQQ